MIITVKNYSAEGISGKKKIERHSNADNTTKSQVPLYKCKFQLEMGKQR